MIIARTQQNDITHPRFLSGSPQPIDNVVAERLGTMSLLPWGLPQLISVSFLATTRLWKLVTVNESLIFFLGVFLDSDPALYTVQARAKPRWKINQFAFVRRKSATYF